MIGHAFEMIVMPRTQILKTPGIGLCQRSELFYNQAAQLSLQLVIVGVLLNVVASRRWRQRRGVDDAPDELGPFGKEFRVVDPNAHPLLKDVEQAGSVDARNM